MKAVKFFLIILCVFTITACSKSDSLKFKEEYEALNGKDNNQGNQYKEVSISKTNPIKYSNYEEIIDVIKNKTGIIYLGYPECPWCRNAIEVLLDVAKEYSINKIYYLNMYNERDYYEVKNGELVYKKDQDGNDIKGNEGYFKLLQALDDQLDDYIIKSGDKSFNVGEKRIYVPLVIFVKDGKVIGTHTSTVSSHKDGYDSLTSKQREELSEIYAEYVSQVSDNVCKGAC